MAEKFMEVTLRIQIQDVDDEVVRQAAADELGIDMEGGSLDMSDDDMQEINDAIKDRYPRLSEVDPHEVAEGIICALGSKEEVEREYVWTGSGVYAEFGSISLVKAGWA